MSHHMRMFVLLTLCVVGVSACTTMQIQNEGIAPNPTASEATAITPAAEPAVTPMLAYVQGGDIWVKALGNSKAQQLTKDGSNQSPQWSASGQWLSFVKNPDSPELWIVQSDGSQAQQIDSTVAQDSYAWSPVEDKLAMAKGAEISVYSFQAGATPQVESKTDVGVPESNGSVGKVAWSPTRQQLAFTLSLPLSSDSATPEVNQADGLWTLDLANKALAQVVESGVPTKGQIVLHGWSSDGNDLLFWQGAILSASMMADGVSLYCVPATGGTPQLLADSVLVQDEAVQSQPDGMPEVAIVEGAGREVWINKSLHSVVISGTEDITLTTADQAVASPAWSPSGDSLAYVAMPATQNVGGGPEAQAVLNQRQLWIVDGASGAAQTVEMSATVREEEPQWIDENTLLVARMDGDGHVSLWQVSRTGDQVEKVVDEISPAPDWFGYYGYIDWRQYFALWLAPSAVEAGVETSPAGVASQVVSSGRKLADFLGGLRADLTSDGAVVLWGQPDVIGGSGLLIYQYALNDGSQLWLGFPGAGPLVYARLHTPDGKFIDLKPTS